MMQPNTMTFMVGPALDGQAAIYFCLCRDDLPNNTVGGQRRFHGSKVSQKQLPYEIDGRRLAISPGEPCGAP
jgi:hypothetical protein